MATRGRKPASKRTAQKTARPKTIDLKASDTNPASAEKPSQRPGGKLSDTTSPISKEAVKGEKPPQGIKENSPQAVKPSGAAGQTDKPSNNDKSDQKTAQKPVDPMQTTNSAGKRADKSGFGALVAAGIFGGVVTAGGLGMVGQANNASSLPIIGSLYSAPDRDDGTDQLSAINSKITELADKIQALESVQTGVSSEVIAKLEQRLANLEQTNTGERDISALANSNTEKIERLSGQISELSNRTTVLSATNNEPAIDELKRAMEKLTLQVEAVRESSGAVTAPQIEQVSESVNKVIGDFESFKASQAAATDQMQTELSNRLSVALKRIDALESTLNEKVISRMDEVVNAAEKATANEKIARSVAVSSLQSAIENGTSYLSAVTSIETLGGESAETKRLRELASMGDIPTVADLKRTFDGLATQLVNPVAEASQDDGLINRFVTSAKSLVSVRPSGPQSGSTPGAVVSRIEASLREGKLGAAIDEWELLPASHREIGQKWFENLKLRDETNRLLETVLQRANKPEIQG